MNQNVDPDTFLYHARQNSKMASEDKQEEALLSWLCSKDDEIKRGWAREFMTLMIAESLSKIVEDQEAYTNLMQLFPDLERVFRLAISIESPGSAMRDHLYHTIRDFLLGDFVLKKLKNKIDSDLLRRFAIATLFHDVAYPIEKVKLAADKIQMLPKFLKTTHKQEFKISGANDLLKILHVIGNLDNEYYKTIYTQMLCPAIAGRGMYDIHHNLSSVVMFLYPIVCQRRQDNEYWKRRSADLKDICFAIAFHDRKMWPIEPIGEIARALRISDELQEWNRSTGSIAFFDDVQIKDGEGILFEMEFKVNINDDDDKFKYEIMIADKLIGLVPVCEKEIIKLTFILSKYIKPSFKKDLISELQKRWTEDYFLNKKFFTEMTIFNWKEKMKFQGDVKRCKKIEILVTGIQGITEVIFNGSSS